MPGDKLVYFEKEFFPLPKIGAFKSEKKPQKIRKNN